MAINNYTTAPQATSPKETYVQAQAAVPTPSPFTPDMVHSAYKNVLGRAADPEGLRHYTSGNEFWGKTPQELEADLRNSAEYRGLATQAQAPVAPKPAYTNPLATPAYANAKSAYVNSLQPSAGVKSAREDYADIIASRDLGIAGVRNKAIPMEFITGQSRAIQEMAEPKALRAQNQVAIEQEQQKMQQDVAKAILDIEQGNIDLMKPFNVGDSIVQFNPETGEIAELYQAPAKADPTAVQKDYEYARAQGYAGSIVDYQRDLAMLNPSAYQVTTDPFGNTSVVNKLDPSGGMRTDRHNNPAAFTTDIAKQAGLVEGVDYVRGDAFPNNPNLFTAKLLGDPVATTIKVIDKIGFYTQGGAPRWTYIAQIPEHKNWANLDYAGKANVVAQMYQREGGNGSLTLGGQTGNQQGGPAATLYQQIKQNPSILSNLSQDQKTAVNNYALQNNLPLPAGQPTQGQSSAAGYASRVEQSNAIFNDLSSAIAKYTPTQMAGYRAADKVGGLANLFIPANVQSQFQAERNFINAVLRRESGAAIAPSEFDSAARQYFPQPGDSAEVLKQKKANRELVQRNLINESGSAYQSTSKYGL